MTDSDRPTNPAPAAGKPLPRSFAAFESIPFRWLISSLLSFFLAMQGGFLVRQLIAWDLTQSELSLAYINLVIAVPMVIGSFIAGAIIDRIERRQLMIVAQCIILANELLVITLLIMGLLTFPLLLVSSCIMGVMFPFVMPTRTAMVFGLVGRDRLANAMALQAATMNVARIVGPAIVGMLVPLITLEGAYITSISLYVISTLTIFMLPRNRADKPSGKSLIKDVKYSFTYVAQHREILLCLVFGLFPMLLTMPVYSMMVVFAEDVFNRGESGLGMLMAMVGVGGITGSLIVARLGDQINRTRWMIASAVLFALMMAAFSITTSFLLALVMLLGANLFADISQTLNNTQIQMLAHNEVRGRMSSLTMLSMGLTPLGVLPVALAAEKYGVANTIFVGSLILLCIVLAFYLLSPSLRSLDARLKAGYQPAPLTGHLDD